MSERNEVTREIRVIGNLTEKMIGIIIADMVAASVRGEIVHLDKEFYALKNDSMFSYWFRFDGISETRTQFYKMSHLYKEYYTLIDKNDEHTVWYNCRTKRVGGIGYKTPRHLIKNGIMKKMIPIFEKYNMNITYCAFYYSPWNNLIFHYDENVDSVYIYIKMHYNLIFAHVYNDNREPFSMRINKQSSLGTCVQKIAKHQVANTEKFIGSCELVERIIKSNYTNFPFAPNELKSISLTDSTYKFHYSDDKHFSLQFNGDAIIQDEFSEFPHSNEIVKEVIGEITQIIKAQITKKIRKITITDIQHYNSKPVITWLDNFCLQHGYTYEYNTSDYTIKTL